MKIRVWVNSNGVEGLSLSYTANDEIFSSVYKLKNAPIIFDLNFEHFTIKCSSGACLQNKFEFYHFVDGKNYEIGKLQSVELNIMDTEPELDLRIKI